ncbi:hypothetical protein AURDEDRAFT_132065 [Auricularia subglabra TFB-10046 SS5]|uniref:Uncharacterized protein n=1 Tax=Auricularia subglabra (strain TFB-10046 / SS5) TaxID=717982 RepID=J0L8G1_AURST|nr:hypothetical protein AURDEDRAFT_132065 [Auricularia subglabra TFB-10046 SS5]
MADRESSASPPPKSRRSPSKSPSKTPTTPKKTPTCEAAHRARHLAAGTKADKILPFLCDPKNKKVKLHCLEPSSDVLSCTTCGGTAIVSWETAQSPGRRWYKCDTCAQEKRGANIDLGPFCVHDKKNEEFRTFKVMEKPRKTRAAGEAKVPAQSLDIKADPETRKDDQPRMKILTKDVKEKLLKQLDDALDDPPVKKRRPVRTEFVGIIETKKAQFEYECLQVPRQCFNWFALPEWLRDYLSETPNVALEVFNVEEDEWKGFGRISSFKNSHNPIRLRIIGSPGASLDEPIEIPTHRLTRLRSLTTSKKRAADTDSDSDHESKRHKTPPKSTTASIKREIKNEKKETVSGTKVKGKGAQPAKK